MDTLRSRTGANNLCIEFVMVSSNDFSVISRFPFHSSTNLFFCKPIFRLHGAGASVREGVCVSARGWM